MQSKRKRAAGRQEETVEDLLRAYREHRAVSREGKHTMLRWLTRASYLVHASGPRVPVDPLGSTDIAGLLNRANATQRMPTPTSLAALETIAASYAAHQEQDTVRLSYAANFFKWWGKLMAVTSGSLLPLHPSQLDDSWLSQKCIDRSLVVPDVRRSAIKIMQLLSVRAGEFDVASEVSGVSTTSCSAVLQVLRTGEWNVTMQSILMYGTLTDIYNAGMVDALYFSVIDSRYQGRLMFTWIKNVIRAPGQCNSLSTSPWPLIYVNGCHYILHWHGNHAVFDTAVAVYSAWAATCVDMGGVVGGRYDVRKCTI